MEKKTMTSEEWNKALDLDFTVVDPDGWDRKNWHYSWYEEKITEQEFMSRCLHSTCLKGGAWGNKIVWEKDG